MGLWKPATGHEISSWLVIYWGIAARDRFEVVMTTFLSLCFGLALTEWVLATFKPFKELLNFAVKVWIAMNLPSQRDVQLRSHSRLTCLQAAFMVQDGHPEKRLVFYIDPHASDRAKVTSIRP